jgi:hypothetical protein
MDEIKAREILRGYIDDKNNLVWESGKGLGDYLHWWVETREATLDGNFSADELEAIVWWMRNKK